MRLFTLLILGCLLASIQESAAQTSSSSTSKTNIQKIGKAQDSKLKLGNTDRTKVLDPDQFMGQAKLAYDAVRKNPELFKHLFCYDGGDIVHGHKTLYDSFTTDYAADDSISQDEALLASELSARGLPLSEIQRRIDTKFSGCYPFATESPALKAYRSSRLYK